ncbi:hypothetical protein Scep_030566 [Stephania cephalantha]|uniref:F-box domain-containing protein n=1 Tax=Stephania cephalantha TaxID=152367 RepID=A0AAP0E2P5_9MAGN
MVVRLGVQGQIVNKIFSMKKKKKMWTSRNSTKRTKIFSEDALTHYDIDEESGYSSTIPEDLLLYGILFRLPAKVLFKFKLVCKYWNNLITHCDSHFAALHNRHAKTIPSNSCFLSVSQKKGIISATYDDNLHFKIPSPDPFLSFSGSANGLLYGYPNYSDYPESGIIIWNPITKQSVTIPKSKRRFLNLALAMDDDFGFAIVGIVITYISSFWVSYLFEVYSSKTREWRRVPNVELLLPREEQFELRNAVYSKGKVYWCLMRHIVWFDVEEETVAGIIPCLSEESGPAYCDWVEIGVCNDGELSCSILTGEGDIDIWLLRTNKRKDDHEFEWVKKHHVETREIFKKNWDLVSRFCYKAKIHTVSELVEVVTREHPIIPLPYLDGDLVWFWMILEVGSKVNHKKRKKLDLKGKLFSINLRNQELKVFNRLKFELHPSIPFLPSLLPCPT